MVTGSVGPPWSVTSASALGSSHRAADAPNQDAVATFETDHGLVVAIADGHGGKRYVRSATGSGFAVAIGQRLGAEVLGAPGPLSTAVERLPAQLVAHWRAAVADDLSRAPLGAEERAVVGNDPVIAYGATLLLVLCRGSEVVALQLGDGDIVAAWRGGPVVRPVPPDPRNVGGQTMSLCLPDAPTSFRIASLTGPSGPPHLVLAATDGYGNSFADPSWPHHVGVDLLDQHLRAGDAAIAAGLPRWVSESAAVGGDDTTVALIFARHGAAPIPPPVLQTGTVSGTPVPPQPPFRLLPLAGVATTRPVGAVRRSPAFGLLAAASVVVVGAGAYAVGRSSATETGGGSSSLESPSSTVDPAMIANPPTVTTTQLPLGPTTTSGRAAPTTAPPTTASPTTASPTTLPVPPPQTLLPGVALDQRVRLVVPGYTIDVDIAGSRATYQGVGDLGDLGVPVSAVSSIGGWWTIAADGSLSVQRSVAADPERVVAGNDPRGRPVALATSAGVVLVALVAATSAEPTLTVLMFDGDAAASLRPLVEIVAASGATNTPDAPGRGDDGAGTVAGQQDAGPSPATTLATSTNPTSATATTLEG